MPTVKIYVCISICVICLAPIFFYDCPTFLRKPKTCVSISASWELWAKLDRYKPKLNSEQLKCRNNSCTQAYQYFGDSNFINTKLNFEPRKDALLPEAWKHNSRIDAFEETFPFQIFNSYEPSPLFRTVR